MLTSLGQLWANGVSVDWDGFHRTERRARVSLPTYPFERQELLDRRAARAAGRAPHARSARYLGLVLPAGVARGRRRSSATAEPLAGRRILVFDEETGLGAAVVERLRALRAASPIVVTQGDAFRACRRATRITSNPSKPDGFRQLAAEVCAGEHPAGGRDRLLERRRRPATTDLDAAAVVTLLGPMRLAHALSSQPTVRPLPMLLVARGTTRVLDDDALDPPRALGAGRGEGAAAGASRTSCRPRRCGRRRARGRSAGRRARGGRAGAGGGAARRPAVRRDLRAAADPSPSTRRSACRSSPVVLVTGGLGHMGMQPRRGHVQPHRARGWCWSAAPRCRSRTNGRRKAKTRPPSRACANAAPPAGAMRAERDEVLVLNADMNDAAQVGLPSTRRSRASAGSTSSCMAPPRIDAAAFASAAETGPSMSSRRSSRPSCAACFI